MIVVIHERLPDLSPPVYEIADRVLAALGMSCDFDVPEHFLALDRLRLPLPRLRVPRWRLHVVQLRPRDGDRIYDFFGMSMAASAQTMGCFVLYPDDISKTGQDTAEWCNGAWPLLRRAPGPHIWRETKPGLNEFVSQLGVFQLEDSCRLPWRKEGWSVRFDEGPYVSRYYGWFSANEAMSPSWAAVQGACLQLARDSFNLTSPGRD